MDSNIKFRNDLITYESLQSAGYKRYDDKSNATKIAVWCKKIRDQSGIKYVIVMSEYHWSEFLDNTISFEPMVQFIDDKDRAINVSFLYQDESIEEIEEFYESMWKTMQFAYNEPY